jgi:hypothetical protein
MVTTRIFSAFAALVALAMTLASCDGGNQTSPVGTDASTSTSFDMTTTTASAKGSDAADTRLQAPLAATAADPLASGTARWESRPDRVTFTCEVEDVTTTGSHQVLVNGVLVGTVNVVAGFGDLNMDSRDGDIIPTMNVGDRVQVRNPSGRVILKGVLVLR